MNHSQFKIKNILPNGCQNNSTLKQWPSGTKTTFQFPHRHLEVKEVGKMMEKGGAGMMLVPALWYGTTCQ
jgi:hypothetical protein